MEYQVSLEVFEGPLDLLLHLIEGEEIQIAAVSLTEIVYQYLDYIQGMGEMDLDTASRFLVVAMELMELKSQDLLPGAEEEDSEESRKQKLVTRLKEYRFFRELALRLKEQEEKQQLVYRRPSASVEFEDQEPRLPPPGQLSLQQLGKAFIQALQEREEEEQITGGYIPAERGPGLKEQLQYLRDRMAEAEEEGLGFSSLVAGLSRIELVVTFLALLELIRLGELGFEQRASEDQLLLYSRRQEGEGKRSTGSN